MRRILVVEDDPLVSETILCVLEEHYRVTLASSVCEATAFLQRGEVDLVLLDCILPGGGAADVIEQAERLGAAVVLTSGDPEQIQAQGGGTRPFLAKPFSMNRLLEVLAAVRVPDSAKLPPPGCLPEMPTHLGPTMPPQSVALRSTSQAAGSWPAMLANTAGAVLIQFAAMTLLALTRVPAAAGSAPHPD